MNDRGVLAGYLVLKPTGGFSILKPQKRYWFVYNDSKCQLSYYKTELSSLTKPPLGFISFHRAAITLLLEEDNHFIIHSEEKEYHLIAEDHEVMMKWLLELQTRRDEWHSQFDQFLEQANVLCGGQTDILSSIESFPSEHEMQTMIKRVKTAEGKCRVTRVRSLGFQSSPSTYSISQLGDRRPYHNGSRRCKSTTSLPRDANYLETTRHFNELLPTMDITSEGRYRTRSVPEVTSDGISEVVDEQPEECFLPADECVSSVSSDSAVCTSECLHLIRIHEMEKEIRITNRKLAETLNREAAYKTTMERLESMVEELEDKLFHLQNGYWWQPSGDRRLSSFRKLEERCQVLKNHNAFLNDEVLKLSRMLQQEQYLQQAKDLQIQEIKNELERIKRDYVFLFLSSIRTFCEEGPEITEIYLYGGSRHKIRVLLLLQEASRVNSGLPNYDILSRRSCHIDSMGFEYRFPDDNFVLHYICRQLHVHYTHQLQHYDRHLAAWSDLCRNDGRLQLTKELKYLVRGGIPDHLRKTVWRHFYRARVEDVIKDKGPYYYKTLLAMIPESQSLLQHNQQITLDLLRTIPNNVRFSNRSSDGVRKLQEVLLAFCLHNPCLGYCQGMNFLVGMCLLVAEPEDAFWCLVAITEKYFPPSYFDQSLIGAQADQEVLKDLLKEIMPNLYRHFMTLDIDLRTVTLNWFLAVFFDAVPFETLLRIWDCFLLEGPKVLFRFSLAILKMQEETILKKQDTVSIMRQLKASAKFCYDVDELIRVAFKELPSFPRRSDIVAKQAYYAKTLKDFAKKRERGRKSFADMLPELVDWKLTAASGPCIDCAVVYDNDKIWLSYCESDGSQIAKINVEECIMYKLNIQCDSRIMCMYSAGSDILILGTLSHVVEAYNTKTRKHISEVKLNDSVLCLSHHEEEGIMLVYAGLADGTLAIIENLCMPDKKTDVFYIIVGSSPVSCLLVLERRLWCSCGNRISIMHARTLDSLDKLQITCNDMDHISTLVLDVHGVWISVRGSSVLQVWDPKNLSCKLIYDIQNNCYNSEFKEEEMIFHPMLITAVLPMEGSIIIGTSNGWMLVYNVVSRRSHSISVAYPYFNGEELALEAMKYQQQLSRQLSATDETPSVTLSNSNISSFPVTSRWSSIHEETALTVRRRPRSAPCHSMQLGASSDMASFVMSRISRSLSELIKRKKENGSVKEEVKCSSISSVDLRQACGSYGLPKEYVYYNYVTRCDIQLSTNQENAERDKTKPRPSSSTTVSVASFSSVEVPYCLELVVKEKINISDKPIKCLLKTRCENVVNIISCSGHYAEEDSVLMWTKEGDEMLWSSEPILDVCPQRKPSDDKSHSYFPHRKFFSASLVSSAGSSFEKMRKPLTQNTVDFGINRMQEFLFGSTKYK